MAQEEIQRVRRSRLSNTRLWIGDTPPVTSPTTSNRIWLDTSGPVPVIFVLDVLGEWVPAWVSEEPVIPDDPPT